jgi:hypothetical protein
MRIVPIALGLVAVGCLPQARAPELVPFVDPDGLYSIGLPGPPASAQAQLSTSRGAVRFKVYGANTDHYMYRISGFAFPGADGKDFDAKGELAQASGQAIAKMRAKVEREEDFAAGSLIGKDVYFRFEDEHGILRVLVSPAPPLQFQLICATHQKSDLAPCRAFADSFRLRAG